MYRYRKQRSWAKEAQQRQDFNKRVDKYTRADESYDKYRNMVTNLNATTELAGRTVEYEQNPDVFARIQATFNRDSINLNDLHTTQQQFKASQDRHQKLWERNNARQFQLYADLQHPELNMNDEKVRSAYWSSHRDEYRHLTNDWNQASIGDRGRALHDAVGSYLTRGGTTTLLDSQLKGYDFDRNNLNSHRDKSQTNSRQGSEFIDLAKDADTRSKQAESSGTEPIDATFREQCDHSTDKDYDQQNVTSTKENIKEATGVSDQDVQELHKKQYQEHQASLKKLSEKLGYISDFKPTRPEGYSAKEEKDRKNRKQDSWNKLLDPLKKSAKTSGAEFLTDGIFGTGIISMRSIHHVISEERERKFEQQKGLQRVMGLNLPSDKGKFKKNRQSNKNDIQNNLNRGQELAEDTFKPKNKSEEKVYESYKAEKAAVDEGPEL